MRLWKIAAGLAAVVFVVGMIGVGAVKAAEEEGRPAELKVLDRWVGDWDLEITVKPSAEMPQGSKSTYKSVIRWALNDRFIKCEAQGEGTAGERKFADAFMWIITHDPRSKNYTSTVFWSTVASGEAGMWGGGQPGIATWDEKEQMMTTRTQERDSGNLGIAVTQWIDKDTHRFVQSITEKNGKVLVEMSGMARRRK
jgi:hypothetical protein